MVSHFLKISGCYQWGARYLMLAATGGQHTMIHRTFIQQNEKTELQCICVSHYMDIMCVCVRELASASPCPSQCRRPTVLWGQLIRWHGALQRSQPMCWQRMKHWVCHSVKPGDVQSIATRAVRSQPMCWQLIFHCIIFPRRYARWCALTWPWLSWRDFL